MPRPARQLPAERVTDWPHERPSDASAEAARQLALNLRTALNGRSLREVSQLTGVSHSSVFNILEGKTWPDLDTIVRLEEGLGEELFPRRR